MGQQVTIDPEVVETLRATLETELEALEAEHARIKGIDPAATAWGCGPSAEEVASAHPAARRGVAQSLQASIKDLRDYIEALRDVVTSFTDEDADQAAAMLILQQRLASPAGGDAR